MKEQAVASNKSCDAKEYALVAKVSKLNGLITNVIGSSLIISITSNIEIRSVGFLK